MTRMPPHRVIVQKAGVAELVLSNYWGKMGDPLAAVVTVSGEVVLQILAPPERASWREEKEIGFRVAVRDLAAAHDLLGHRGPVTVVIDPGTPHERIHPMGR